MSTGAPAPMPAAEVAVDATLVRHLLAAQHPDLAALPLRPAGEGWDNVLFRLGDELAVRLPRRQLGVPLVANEQRWLPALAPHLPLPIPTPVRIGHPGEVYPWPWSVVPWIDGIPACDRPPDDPGVTAEVLGRFLAALHRPAPEDAPRNPYRGIPLPDRTPNVQTALDRLGALVDRAAVEERWARCTAAEPWTGPPLWLHGDLHAGNVLVHAGAISGVIDFGDLTGGDPATDLMVAWMLVDPAEHGRFRSAYGGIDDATWIRGQGWAITHALAVWAHADGLPAYEAMARRSLAAVLASS